MNKALDKDLLELVPEFRDKVLILLDNCDKRGASLEPYFGLRTPLEQAKLWRQSRATYEIQAQISNLRRQGCDYLASCIERAGRQSGRWATNAIPGLSWHNWGQAIDCFAVHSKGGANWDSGAKEYRIYAEEAVKLGMEAGYYWPRRSRDPVHVQAKKGSLSSLYSLKQINDIMKERFPINNA